MTKYGCRRDIGGETYAAITNQLASVGGVEGVGIGGASLAPLHCRLLTNWAASRPGEGGPATSFTTFAGFERIVCEKCTGSRRSQTTFFPTSPVEGGEGGKREIEPLRFPSNSGQ